MVVEMNGQDEGHLRQKLVPRKRHQLTRTSTGAHIGTFLVYWRPNQYRSTPRLEFPAVFFAPMGCHECANAKDCDDCDVGVTVTPIHK